MPNEPAPRDTETFRFRMQAFDVVLVKVGVRAHEAKPDEFRRVTVSATGPVEAERHEDVAAILPEGWAVHRAMGRGQVTHEEQAAVARAHAATRPPRGEPGDVAPTMTDRD